MSYNLSTEPAISSSRRFSALSVAGLRADRIAWHTPRTSRPSLAAVRSGLTLRPHSCASELSAVVSWPVCRVNKHNHHHYQKTTQKSLCTRLKSICVAVHHRLETN
jgi:hypothetical protein